MADGLQPGMIEDAAARIAALRRAFEERADVTTDEFMKLSAARDDLSDLLRRMYETCIYKDD